MLRKIITESTISGSVNDEIKRIENVLINTLKYVGEKAIADARTNGNYIDRTGNLRNSIGYIIHVNGNMVYSELSSLNSDFANSLSARNKGISLIVVAGMNYAEHVEALGRNVITSAELMAEVLVPKLLSQLGFK